MLMYLGILAVSYFFTLTFTVILCHTAQDTRHHRTRNEQRANLQLEVRPKLQPTVIIAAAWR